MAFPRIILLNGISSAGKSSIARALQQITREPFLHVQMDDFLSMMPPRYANHPDALGFVPRQIDGQTEIGISIGQYGTALLSGMRRSIAAMAEQGLNVIVDYIMLENEIEDYRTVLKPFDFRVVGVVCSLADAEAREIARGDRLIGLARWQLPRVHTGIDYDLQVDTSQHAPESCAEAIRSALDL